MIENYQHTINMYVLIVTMTEVYLRIHYNNIDWWGCFQRLEKSVVQILFESYE